MEDYEPIVEIFGGELRYFHPLKAPRASRQFRRVRYFGKLGPLALAQVYAYLILEPLIAGAGSAERPLVLRIHPSHHPQPRWLACPPWHRITHHCHAAEEDQMLDRQQAGGELRPWARIEFVVNLSGDLADAFARSWRHL
jgi:hypothetical protein